MEGDIAPLMLVAGGALGAVLVARLSTRRRGRRKIDMGRQKLEPLNYVVAMLGVAALIYGLYLRGTGG